MRAPELSIECPVRWESLRGEGTTRFCEICETDVVDLSSCTREQAREVLSRPRACVRFIRSSAGLLLFGAIAASALPGAAHAGEKPEGELPVFQETTGAVMGAFDRTLIQDAMVEAMPRIRDAWTRSDANRRGEGGLLVLKFQLHDGVISDVEIKRSELEDEAFHEALIETLEGRTVEGGARAFVTYPLRFTADPERAPKGRRPGRR